MARFEGVYRLESVELLPDVLDPSVVYVAGEKGHEYHVAFLCPCGCGGEVHLNLVPASDCWRLNRNGDGTFSITPSVLWRFGCLSHFFITNSRVRWC